MPDQGVRHSARAVSGCDLGLPRRRQHQGAQPLRFRQSRRTASDDKRLERKTAGKIEIEPGPHDKLHVSCHALPSPTLACGTAPGAPSPVGTGCGPTRARFGNSAANPSALVLVARLGLRIGSRRVCDRAAAGRHAVALSLAVAANCGWGTAGLARPGPALLRLGAAALLATAAQHGFL